MAPLVTSFSSARKIYLSIVLLFITVSAFAQKPKDYLIYHEDTTGKQRYGFVFTNVAGDAVLRLDTAQYYFCTTDTMYYFAVVGLTHKRGWWAIDRDEKILFQVYNTSYGEPSPDEVTDGMIRITDDSGRIGFANSRGEIVIKPAFEVASEFYHGHAIIGKKCKKVLWCCEGENEDKHYCNDCSLTGYINKKGQILEMGKLTLEQMAKKLKWPTN